MKPKVSIITSTFNCQNHIQKTIDSIANQDYPNLEYLIIDGKSSDNTINIIEQNQDKIDFFLSESDSGISEAFNKGIKHSNGDYLYFIGAGDTLKDNQVISKMMENIDKDKDLLICGRVARTSLDGKILWSTKYIKNFDKRSLLFKMSLPHQGLFTHKSLFDRYGLFDENNKYCMDYEHLLRYYKVFPKIITKDIIVASWNEGGIGSNKLLEVFNEYNYIKHKHKIASNIVLTIIHYWTILKYKIKLFIKGSY